MESELTLHRFIDLCGSHSLKIAYTAEGGRPEIERKLLMGWEIWILRTELERLGSE